MRKIVRILVGLIGAIAGLVIGLFLNGLQVFASLSKFWIFIIVGIITIGGFILFYFLFPFFARTLNSMEDSLVKRFEGRPLSDMIIAIGGLFIGLLIAMIISNPVLSLSINYVGNVIGVLIAICIYIFFGLFGIRLALSNADEIKALFFPKDKPKKQKTLKTPKEEKNKHHFHLLGKKGHSQDQEEIEAEEDEESLDLFENPLAMLPDVHEAEVFEGKDPLVVPKILDTSVIIDGRIFSVIKAGFLEGPIVISKYVLEELQHISDSSDTQRRERGRKGLDWVYEMRKTPELTVIVDSQNIDAANEVDAKLLILTRRYQGWIVTNDYNLNKVASVQNIRVLNVNDLANALKPVVIPGESMRIKILKAGKEVGQGLAYLDDGTMIVIEDGGEAIGETVDTTVTSVLQTSAGKMIFTRIHPVRDALPGN